MNQQQLINVNQVAELLGCSWRTVLRLADQGKMPPGVKIGAMRRWDVDQLEAWLAAGCPVVRTATRRPRGQPAA